MGTCTPVLILVGWFQSRNGGRTYSNSYHTKICKVSAALELKESMAKRKTTLVLWVDPYFGDPVSHRFAPHRSQGSVMKVESSVDGPPVKASVE